MRHVSTNQEKAKTNCIIVHFEHRTKWSDTLDEGSRVKNRLNH